MRVIVPPEVLAEALEEIKLLTKVSPKFGAILYSLDWPPPTDFSPAEMMEVVRLVSGLSQEEARRAIDRLMLRRYGKQRLRRLLWEWKDERWLQRRFPILESVVEAHIEKKYWLSVPALLPQIEGIVAEHEKYVGHLTRRDWETLLQRVLDDEYSHSYDRYIREFMLLAVLARWQHGVDPPSELNRHAILHGRDTEYGRATVSLKAILLFDYLQKAISFKQSELSVGF